MAINGRYYDWESIAIMGPGGIMIGITEISYDDELATEARYGKGAVPRGYGLGNYKASGSITLDRDEADRLRLIRGGSVYGRGTFPIVVSYANDDQPPTIDILPDCRTTKQDTSTKQGDDNAGAVKFDIEILSPIKWGGVSAYPA